MMRLPTCKYAICKVFEPSCDEALPSIVHYKRYALRHVALPRLLWRLGELSYEFFVFEP